MISDERIERALRIIAKRSANHEYFFEHLDSPDWIEPLRARGLFSSPPAAVYEGGFIRFPIWYESRFLSRMAPRAPDKVAEVLLALPETDNERVHVDVAEAAIRLPAELAAALASKEAAWLGTREKLYLNLEARYTDLGLFLVKEGHVDSSIELFLRLLSLRRSGEAPRRGVVSVLDRWDYRQVLRSVVPVMGTLAPRRFLFLLSDLLETAAPPISDNGGGGSSWWQPAVEEHEQNEAHEDYENHLVAAIRDLVATALEAGCLVLEETVAELEGRGGSIFRRLALHLLVERGERSPALANSRVVRRDYLEDSSLFHEYTRLLRSRFSGLEKDDQQLLVTWICEGPRSLADLPEGSDRAAVVRYWTFRRLWNVREWLPVEARGTFDALKAEFGEPSHPEFLIFMTEQGAPESPYSKAELGRMEIPELVSRLSEFRPSPQWVGSDRNALADHLASVVGADPARFVGELQRLEELHPAFIVGVLGGLEVACKQRVAVDWSRVLPWMARLAVKESPRNRLELTADRDFGDVRTGILNVLDDALQLDAVREDLRALVWAAIEPITKDPEPTEEVDYRTTMDPFTASINRVRSRALHTVLQYALWVRRMWERARPENKGNGPTWAAMPEVLNVLEWHLDLGQERSPAVRAVYGYWLPWIWLLDPRWVELRLGEILPKDPERLAFREAAWASYLIFRPPYRDFVEVVLPEYEWAVDQLNTDYLFDWPAEPKERLAEHLITLLARGRFEADSEIICRFIERASPTVLRSSLASAAEILQEEGKAPRELVRRLERYYDQVAEMRKDNGSQYLEMVGPLGLWFASGQIDEDWGVVRVLEALRNGATLDADFLMAKELVRLAGKKPRSALEILEAMASRDSTRWGITGWLGEAEEVLRLGLANPKSAAYATDIIHSLGAQGHFGFGRLLESEG